MGAEVGVRGDWVLTDSVSTRRHHGSACAGMPASGREAGHTDASGAAFRPVGLTWRASPEPCWFLASPVAGICQLGVHNGQVKGNEHQLAQPQRQRAQCLPGAVIVIVHTSLLGPLHSTSSCQVVFMLRSCLRNAENKLGLSAHAAYLKQAPAVPWPMVPQGNSCSVCLTGCHACHKCTDDTVTRG